MGEIKNVATLTNDEQANINRAAIEHRATWMGLIYDELKKDGIDPEPAFRRAIKRCGNIHGANFKAACSNPDDCRDFAEVFLSPFIIYSFIFCDLLYLTKLIISVFI